MKISNSNEVPAEHSSTGLNGQFLHFQLFIDCLIRLKPSDDDQSELLAACRHCYQHDSEQLKLIDEFQESYSADRAIWWYTRESFVYHLVNRALRRQDIDQLYRFRSFIRDLGKQLQIYRSHSPMCVYRAQRMCKQEIATLQQSVGQYISMSSFLSTSLNQAQTRAFLLANFCSQDHEQVLFEIHTDPGSELGQVFSNVSAQSFVPREQEVIFMIGSIFQLVQMKRDAANLWKISLVLCSQQEKYLQILGQHMKDELGTGETSLYSFGHVLGKMGKWNEAERYFQQYLQQLPKDDPHVALCYHALGCVADSRGDDQTSLNCYRKCLEMSMKTDKPDQFNLTTIHNSMAVVYRKQGDSARSLEAFERALAISIQTFGDDDVNVAMCLNNIAGLHSQEKNYATALECYQKALVVWQKHLPADHPDLGALFNNIGGIYHCLGQHQVALASYKISLDIKLKSLPDKHPDIAMTLKNIGLVYERGGHFEKALKYFQKAAEIYGNSHSSVQIQEDIKRVSFIEQ